jgi:hypothetical protein
MKIDASLCTDTQVLNRVRTGAERKAKRLWPILVELEAKEPEPNLIKPVALVTIQQLEQFLFDAMMRNVERGHGR